MIVGKYCSWKYRGLGCQYSGFPVCKENNEPFEYIDMDKASQTEWASKWNKKKSYQKGDIVFTEDIKEPIGGQGEEYRKVYYVKNSKGTSDTPEIKYSSTISPGDDPEHWEQDACSKTIDGCMKRFPGDQALPFGGFPGTDNFYYYG